ncbi:hypothetical protein F5883DRAFT_688089 [Diaporthe sp. PMI_573]|nr:hypothetical protein F5883DRAFT_688089 [Diaporthaceae sp. PMI_573]
MRNSRPSTAAAGRGGTAPSAAVLGAASTPGFTFFHVKGAANSRNPLQDVIFATEIQERDRMEPSLEELWTATTNQGRTPDKLKGFLEMRHSLNQLEQIKGWAAVVWAKLPSADIDGGDALSRVKKLQKDVETQASAAADNTNTTRPSEAIYNPTKVYLELTSLLLYTTRTLLRYFGNMVNEWLSYMEVAHKSGALELAVKKQIITAVAALSNAQDTWHELMRAPRAVAWALHFLQGEPTVHDRQPTTTSLKQVDPTEEDGVDLTERGAAPRGRG